MNTIELTVNGVARRAQVQPRTTLVDWLLGVLGLTGTHIGYSHGVCGARMVIVDGQPLRGCLMRSRLAEGMTVEGLSSPEALTPLQAAFRKHAAAHCGFCPHGIITTMYARLSAGPGGAALAQPADQVRGHAVSRFHLRYSAPHIAFMRSEIERGRVLVHGRHPPR